MRFTKKDITNLIEKYGRAYYNPGLNAKSKQNFLKIIRTESFPHFTIDELGQKLDVLYRKYLTCKKEIDKKSFEFYSIIDKTVKLANLDYLPKPKSVVIDCISDEEEDISPKNEEKIQYIPKQSNIQAKRSNDGEIVMNDFKRSKLDDSAIESTNESNGSAVQSDQKILDKIAEYFEKKEAECANLFEAKFIALSKELQMIVKKATEDIVLAMQKKEQRFEIMMKTLLDEQNETNDKLKEILTAQKSIIAGQRVQNDNDVKSNEFRKSDRDLLQQILKILQEKK